MEREAYGLQPLRGDLVWGLRTVVGTQTMALTAGTIAGLLGLGGGELMAPLLVHLGGCQGVPRSASECR